MDRLKANSKQLHKAANNQIRKYNVLHNTLLCGCMYTYLRSSSSFWPHDEGARILNATSYLEIAKMPLDIKIQKVHLNVIFMLRFYPKPHKPVCMIPRFLYTHAQLRLLLGVSFVLLLNIRSCCPLRLRLSLYYDHQQCSKMVLYLLEKVHWLDYYSFAGLEPLSHFENRSSKPPHVIVYTTCNSYMYSKHAPQKRSQRL